MAALTPSYADMAKSERKKKWLIIKMTDEDVKMSERKKDVTVALKDVTLISTKNNEDGNVVMNFESEAMREKAKRVISCNVTNSSVKKVGKMKPKFMICNVNKNEEPDDITETLIDKNDILKSVPDIKKNINFFFLKRAARGTVHVLFKCEPEIHKLLHDHGDIVKLTWGYYTIRDRYYVRICQHCQRYGHSATECRHKNEKVICGKCTGDHDTRSCSSESVKCINCARQNIADANIGLWKMKS